MHRKSVASYKRAGEFFKVGSSQLKEALKLRKLARREGDKSMFPEVVRLSNAASAEFDKAVADYRRCARKGR
jgi:hypothetical protein